MYDTTTKLVWMRCSLGQTWNGAKSKCTGQAKGFTFDEAQQAANALNAKGYSGHTDWVVPTIRQLHSLIYCSSGKTVYTADLEDGGAELANLCRGEYELPTIDAGAFPNTPATPFWSSSPYVDSATRAWDVSFGYGSVDDYAVRLVRASQWVDDR